MKVYLDYAATSPVKKEVFEAMRPYFSEKFGNASSLHLSGIIAREAVELSRNKIAMFLNCAREEIIFTSGGTESDNLAIRGIILATSDKRQATSNKPHIITSAFEHHAVLETCKDLEKRQLAEVTFIKPNKQGIIEIDSINKAIKPNTILVSIMYVNNEIGTVQPILEIGKILKNTNEKRIATNKQRIYFHTDAVQAIEYQNCNVKKFGVDMLTLSAHKFGGPKGVGVLFIKKGIPMHRENIGGEQEFGLRSGTENVAGIVGIGRAIELVTSNKRPSNSAGRQVTSKIRKLRDYFIDRILKEIPDTRLNGDREKRSPNNINVSFKYIEGEAILLHLDRAGIAASSGSACASGSSDPSHVLLSIGLKPEDAHGSIRFTISSETTKKEIDYTISHLKNTVKKLRRMSPFNK